MCEESAAQPQAPTAHVSGKLVVAPQHRDALNVPPVDVHSALVGQATTVVPAHARTHVLQYRFPSAPQVAYSGPGHPTPHAAAQAA